jgi:hypothetical protein
MTYDRDDVACHHCFEQKALKDWIKSEGKEHLSMVRAPRRAPAAGKAAFRLVAPSGYPCASIL